MKSGLSLLAAVDSTLRRPGRILIAADFDGTLCPLVDTPSEAALTPVMAALLNQIVTFPRFTLAIITGRRLTDIEGRCPAGAIFAGNHGLEIRGANLHFEHEGARNLRPVIAESCEALQAATAPWPAAWVEDKDLTATLHFRKVQSVYRETLLFAARKTLGAFGPKIAMRAGRDALEIRPRISWDKGSALAYIYEQVGSFDACISLGDDRTDESMFRAACCDVSVRIGCSRTTAAAFCLSEPDDVSQLFSHIVENCGADGQPMEQGFIKPAQNPPRGGSLTADHAGPGH